MPESLDTEDTIRLEQEMAFSESLTMALHAAQYTWVKNHFFRLRGQELPLTVMLLGLSDFVSENLAALFGGLSTEDRQSILQQWCADLCPAVEYLVRESR